MNGDFRPLRAGGISLLQGVRRRDGFTVAVQVRRTLREGHLPLTCRAGPNRKSLPRRNPRFYFSTTRFREIFPDPLCGGGPLHVARPVI